MGKVRVASVMSPASGLVLGSVSRVVKEDEIWDGRPTGRLLPFGRPERPKRMGCRGAGGISRPADWRFSRVVAD